MKNLIVFVLSLALAPIPALAQRPQRGYDGRADQRQAAPQQRQATPPQARQPQSAPQRGAQQAQPRQQTAPQARSQREARPQQPAPRGYYGTHAPHYWPPYGGSRMYFGHGSWRPLIVVSGWWGYWDYGVWYPTYRYYPPYYGGPAIYGGYYGAATGLKFDLALIPKVEREVVKGGVVVIDGGEVGAVRNFEGSWRSALPLTPGTYDVSVVLEDGRQMDTTVRVLPGRITHISLRFPPPPPNQPPPPGGEQP